MKIIEIAKSQATPPRFLEAILNQLKQAGFVDAKRGKHGGYYLLRSPEELTVGEVMRAIQGPVQLVENFAEGMEGDSLPKNNSVFLPMWIEAQEAISMVYDKTTFQDFLDREKQESENRNQNYSI